MKLSTLKLLVKEAVSEAVDRHGRSIKKIATEVASDISMAREYKDASKTHHIQQDAFKDISWAICQYTN